MGPNHSNTDEKVFAPPPVCRDSVEKYILLGQISWEYLG